jgi:hypothetical protein
MEIINNIIIINNGIKVPFYMMYYIIDWELLSLIGYYLLVMANNLKFLSHIIWFSYTIFIKYS